MNKLVKKNIYPRDFQHPLFLGMDSLFANLDKMADQKIPSYPKFSILKAKDDSHNIIKVAIAGLNSDYIEVSHNPSKKTVNISYDNPEMVDDTEYTCIHNGISQKDFSVDFLVPSGAKVSSANIENGILSVVVDLPVSNSTIKKIEISKK